MSHDEHHEHITLAEFIDEYWVLFFFGTFFLITCFAPLLFLDNKNWLYWGIIITLCIALALLTVPALLHKSKQSK